MIDAGTNPRSSQAREDPDPEFYEHQTEEEMIAEVVAARKVGTLRRGGVNAKRTDPAILEARVATAFDEESAKETQAEVEETKRDGHSADPLIPVTVRMPATMLSALKAEADRLGVRGYQTLLKRWIEERLAGEMVVSVRQVAVALKPLQQLIDAEAARSPE